MTRHITRRYDVPCAGGGVSGVVAAGRAARGGGPGGPPARACRLVS